MQPLTTWICQNHLQHCIRVWLPRMVQIEKKGPQMMHKYAYITDTLKLSSCWHKIFRKTKQPTCARCYFERNTRVECYSEH
jgi:hypothetical protein